MGSVLPLATLVREVRVTVRGGAALESLELLRNNRVVASRHGPEPPAEPIYDPAHARLLLEVGWGERGSVTNWDLRLGIDEGRILRVEPRLRGSETVAPAASEPDSYAVSRVERRDDRTVRLVTATQSNPTTSTPGMQAVALEVEMPLDSGVWADFGVKRERYTLRELLEGSRTGYLGGFVTPAYRFARAVLPEQYHWQLDLHDVVPAGEGRDWYYVRVKQTNGQCAWSSPIWVSRK